MGGLLFYEWPGRERRANGPEDRFARAASGIEMQIKCRKKKKSIHDICNYKQWVLMISVEENPESGEGGVQNCMLFDILPLNLHTGRIRPQAIPT
jgi:hypothetical protein